MRSAINPQFVLSVCLLSLAGARAAPAAEPAAEPQEQARLLLVGKRFPAGQPKSRGAAGLAAGLQPAAETAAPATETAIDGQEQARLLLAGRNPPVSRPKSRGADRSAAAALPSVGATSPASDPQEQARRMILGREFQANSNSAAVNSSGRVTANIAGPRGTP